MSKNLYSTLITNETFFSSFFSLKRSTEQLHLEKDVGDLDFMSALPQCNKKMKGFYAPKKR